jgi:hypothetical protein
MLILKSFHFIFYKYSQFTSNRKSNIEQIKAKFLFWKMTKVLMSTQVIVLVILVTTSELYKIDQAIGVRIKRDSGSSNSSTDATDGLSIIKDTYSCQESYTLTALGECVENCKENHTMTSKGICHPDYY